MRSVLIGLVVATSGLCVACTDHQQRPVVSPAAAKRAIEQRAREWSSSGKIVDLSCRSDPADRAAIICDGSPAECQGGTPIERWSVHRGTKGKAVVSEPEQKVYCIVTSDSEDGARYCQSHPYLTCDATDP
jgi:hypothetical protein